MWHSKLHVHFMEIVVTECGITFRTLSLSCIIPRFQAINTKDMETFGKDSIFRTRVTNRTHQFCLGKKSNEEMNTLRKLKHIH